MSLESKFVFDRSIRFLSSEKTQLSAYQDQKETAIIKRHLNLFRS